MLKRIKAILVGIIIFFGAAFAIMAFHNDIGIVNLFEQIYLQVTGTVPETMGGLEIGYCRELIAGSLFFFDHLNLQKQKDDPTPLQVEMFKYDQDVQNTKDSRENDKRSNR